MPATWDENVAAYEKMKDYLEDEYFLHWAVFYDGELVGIYDDGSGSPPGIMDTIPSRPVSHQAGW